MSFSEDSATVDEAPAGEAPVGGAQVVEPFLVDTHDESYREDSDQAAAVATVGATPRKSIGELDEMLDQEPLETTSSDSCDYVRRKKAALLFVIMLLSFMRIYLPFGATDHTS
jgi:hypothetical protein